MDAVKPYSTNFTISIATPGYKIRTPPSFDFIQGKQFYAHNMVYVTRAGQLTTSLIYE